MTYKESLMRTWEHMEKEHGATYIGYNTVKGSRMYGTLQGVPESSCVEMPVSENLMMGMGVGMALAGKLAVVCFERHDFLLLGMDALVNHADKFCELGAGKCKMIVRAIVGSNRPLRAGVQHTQDYTDVLKRVLKNSYVINYLSHMQKAPKGELISMMDRAPSGVVVVVEHRDKFDVTI